MKRKIFLAILVIISLFCINVDAKQSKYVLRDSILRRRCSDIDRITDKTVPKYNAAIIKYDGVKIAVLKGTEIKEYTEIKDAKGRVHYYKVKIEADGVNYLSDFEGYILATNLSDKKIKMDSKKDRSLLVNEKTTFVKNALNVMKAGDDESDSIVFKYPTTGAIAKELGMTTAEVKELKKNNNAVFQDKKSQLRKTGYEFVIKNKKFTTQNTSLGKNIYYFSCTSFANTLYAGTFRINPTKDDGTYYLLGAYLTDAKKKKQFYNVRTITTAGEKLYTSQIQIGDAVIGLHNAKADGTTREGHIMVYIGDGLVIHSTSSEVGVAADDTYSSVHINYLNSNINGTKNYYSVLGEDRAYEKSLSVIRILKDKKGTKRSITYSKSENKFEVQ